jgi:tape measure domain-containing protein
MYGELGDLEPLDAGKLVEGADEAEQELEDIGDKAEQTSAKIQEGNSEGGGSFSGLLSGIGDATGGFMDFIGTVGNAAGGLVDFAEKAINTGAALLQPAATAEQTQNAFATLMHSTSAAADEMQRLNTFAAQTPFQTQDIDDAAQKLLAYGFNAQSVIPDITGIGDALSALGKNSSAYLQQVVDVFGKIQASGKLSAQDMMQLSSVGIPAWQMLAKSMGSTVPELQNMVSKGLVPASTALPELQKGMEDTFGGSMAKQAGTFNGLVSTLASNWNLAMAAMGSPVLKEVEQGLTNIGNVLSSKGFQDFASGVGQKIADVVDRISEMAERGAGTMGRLMTIFDSPTAAALASSLGMLADKLVTLAEAGGNTALQFLSNFVNALTAPNKGAKNLAQEGMGGLADALIQASYGLNKFIGFLDRVDTYPLANGLANIALILGTGLVNAIDTVAPLIDNLTNFFASNSVQAQIVEDLMIGIGVAIAAIEIGSFVAAIPALVVGFGAWAIAAGSAAVATIAATWPIIAIGAGIALVVGGIILAVQHWGDISKWLQGAWANVDKFFSGLLQNIQNTFGNIGGWFHDRFTDAKNSITSALAGAGDSVKSAGSDIEKNWQDTVDNLIKGGQWLYDHNTYVKQFVDDSSKKFQDLQKDLSKDWDDIQKDTSTAWKNLQNGASTAGKSISDNWTNATNFMSGKFSWLGGKAKEGSDAVGSAWQSGVTFVSGQWDRFAGFTDQVWGNISNIFGSAWDRYIAGPMGNLWDRFTGWWDGLINQASTVGGQVIQSIVDGINAGIGNIGNAIHGAVGQGLADLGFHDIPGFAAGTDSAPGGLAMVGEQGPELVNLPRGSQVIPLQGAGVRTLAAATSAMNTTTQANAGMLTAIFQVDSRELARIVGPATQREVRLKLGTKK